jgi:hypothetical protein
MQSLDAMQDAEISVSSDEQRAGASESEAISGLSLPRREQSNMAQGLAKQKQQVAEQKNKQMISDEQARDAQMAASPMPSKASTPAPAALQSFSALVEQSAEEAEDGRSAEEHVKYMQQLLDAGQYDELNDEMLIFRASYADYELPPALQQWERRAASEKAD